jgi:redox-sensing transcriptional repressor
MQRKGYDVRELIEVIGKILDSERGLNVAVVGIGNLGRAITSYFLGKRSKLNIVASFDVDTNKVNRVIAGVKCYAISQMQEVIAEKNIAIAIITVPADQAREIAENLYVAGVKGLLNFTTVPLNVSPDVYIDEYDMITSLEKVAYFVKMQQRMVAELEH